MKSILILMIFLCGISLPVLGALTDTDLAQIRLIVQEELEKEIKPIKADIVTLQTDGAMLKTEVKNLKDNMNTVFASVR